MLLGFGLIRKYRLLGQEFFYLHPVEKGFGTEDLDLVDGRVDGSIQFDGTQVDGRIVVQISSEVLYISARMGCRSPLSICL